MSRRSYARGSDRNHEYDRVEKSLRERGQANPLEGNGLHGLWKGRNDQSNSLPDET